jgi:hypothetical protein
MLFEQRAACLPFTPLALSSSIRDIKYATQIVASDFSSVIFGLLSPALSKAQIELHSICHVCK